MRILCFKMKGLVICIVLPCVTKHACRGVGWVGMCVGGGVGCGRSVSVCRLWIGSRKRVAGTMIPNNLLWRMLIEKSILHYQLWYKH